MTSENKIKAKNMLAIAESYRESAMFLPTFNEIIKTKAKEQNILMPNGEPVKFDSVYITSVVLYGLAVEILFKALIVSEDADFGRLHNHVELFNALSSASQSEIIDAMPDQFKADFTNLLEKNKHTFIDWRYCYEKDALSCDVTFLKELSSTLASKLLQITK